MYVTNSYIGWVGGIGVWLKWRYSISQYQATAFGIALMWNHSIFNVVPSSEETSF